MAYGLAFNAEATVIPTGGSIDEQVTWLMEEALKLRSLMGESKQALIFEITQLRTDNAAETQTRDAEVRDVRKSVEGLAGNLLWISAIGVALLIAGQFR